MADRQPLDHCACVAASSTTSAGLPELTSTSFPSGVNLSRLAPGTFAFSVAVTRFAARSIDRDRAILRVRDPCLFAIGRNVKSLRAVPTGITVSFQSPPGGPRQPTCSILPARARRTRRWRRHARRRSHRRSRCAFCIIQNRDRCRVHVGGHDAFGVGKHIEHVRPVLADAHDAIDFAGCRIIAADRLRRLRREPQLAPAKSNPCGPRSAPRSMVPSASVRPGRLR